MNQSQRRAVTAAAMRAADGRPVTLSDRKFWKTHPGLTTAERRDVIARAASIGQAAGGIDFDNPAGTVGDLFAGTDYPAGGGDTGPADTQSARVFAKAAFDLPKGKVAVRSLSVKADWDTPLEDILADLYEQIEEMETEYGFGEGALLGGTIVIY